ncbi:MAG: YHYH protein [Myxococcota bacterium]
MQTRPWLLSFVVIGFLASACSDPDEPGADADGESGAEQDTGSNPTADGESGAEDSAASAGHDAIAEAILGAMWADDMSVTMDGESIVLESDGLPEHDVLEAYALMDGSTIGVDASSQSITIPAIPVYSDTVTETGLGAIGMAISGGVYFNPYEGDGTSVALDNNFDVGGVPFIDPCNGHPLPDGGTYHYHGVPYCITDVVDTPGEHSVIIGALLDGFPVYGPFGADGEPPADLDECSGHEGATPECPDGIYHYHLTEMSPYSITCYHGEVEDSGMPPGPPPGG